MGTTGWLIAIGVIVLLWVIVTFNAFVRLGNKVDEGFSGVDVQLKRRHDLVPNLVRVVKGYAKHEKETLEGVIEARNQAQAADKIEDRSERESTLAGSLGKLFALVEQYPDLKADKNFRKLQEDLVEIEDALQYARRYYNGTVRDYNTRIQRFPANVLAGLIGRKDREFFQLEDDAERHAPAVSLDS